MFLYFTLLLENKIYNFLFIKKLKNYLYDKMSIYPLNNITHIILV
jgi:hypothetical protein